MRRGLLTAAAVLGACSRSSAPPAPAEVAPTEVAQTAVPAVDATVAAVATVDAASAIDCGEFLGPIARNVRLAFEAKEPHPRRKQVRELWPLVPEPCRTGVWYLYAAMLVDETPFEAPGVTLRTRDEALAAAVAQPPDADVLAYVAFTAALGGTTALPADACALAEAEAALVPESVDDANYVCGHAALAAGDPKTARTRFDAIEYAPHYLDLELRQAEAALADGDRKAARVLAKKASAIDDHRRRRARASSDDREAVVARAKQLAR